MGRSETAGEPPADFATVFSAAVSRQQLTLDRLQVRLKQAGVPVSSATLSYWQTGRSVPTRRRSLRSLEELERILQLPEGHLVRALPTDEPAPAAGGRSLPSGVLVERILADMGLDMERRWSGISDQVLTVVGEDRTEVSQLSVQLVQSSESGMQRIPVVFRQDADRPCAPVIEHTTACSVGRSVSVPEAHLLVAELVLPRPLARGEMHQMAYRVGWARNGLPSFRMERTLLNRHRMFSATIEFRGDPPVQAQRYHLSTHPARLSPDDLAPVTNGVPVPVAGQHIQSVLLDAEPGVHGLQWSW